jgi:hypothetical protein
MIGFSDADRIPAETKGATPPRMELIAPGVLSGSRFFPHA